MAFLVLHQVLEQLARHVILHRVAVSRRLLIKLARADLGREIAFQNLFDVLPDAQRVEDLQVREPVEDRRKKPNDE